MPELGATRILANWASSLTFEQIPADVVAHAKLCLMDGLGCALYGSQLEWGRISADVATETAPGGAATLWGTSGAPAPRRQRFATERPCTVLNWMTCTSARCCIRRQL